MTFSGLRIRARFTVLMFMFIAGFAVYGGWSFKTLNGLKVNGPLYQRIVQSKDLVADVLPPPEYVIESYLVSMQLSAAQDKARQDKLIDRLKTLKADYETRHEYWSKAGLDPAVADALLKQAHEPATAFYTHIFNDLVPAVQKGDKDAQTAAAAKINDAYEAHRQAIDKVVDMANKRVERDEAAAADSISTDTGLLLAILALSIGASGSVGWMIMRGIIGPLNEAVHVAKTVASGDLTLAIEARGKDETAELLQALKEMNGSLVSIVTQVRAGTIAIADASSQIAEGNMDLSHRTEEQAGSLEETSAAMEELTGTVRQNAEHAGQANQLAVAASEVATKGGAVVSEVVQTMGSINDSSRKVVDIIAVIDGIAFQTNILALNAAVEAARAGEQGRGFAVVAAEVRNLAQRSAAAAKEIKALISDSVEKVDAGSKLVDQAGATMDEVVTAVKRVTDIISEIAEASSEQTSEIQQIGDSLARMDQVTQQNAALVEEAAAAADSMHHQTEKLANLVSVFKLDATASSAAVTSIRRKAPASPASKPKAIPAPAAKKLALAGAGASGGDDSWEEF